MISAPFPHRMIPTGRQIRHDALLGHAFVASVCRRIPHEHGAYFAVTNAEGFREDHDLVRPPGGFHVMCYGDSYAAGDGVDNGERFSTILARELGITVSNVAVPGHGPDQNVLQLERVPLPRPDLILWCIAVQTIERIQSGTRITIDRLGRLWRVDRPHFALAADGALQLRGVPVAERGEELAEAPCPQIRAPIAAIATRAKAKVRARLVAAIGPWLKPAPDPDYADPKSAGWRLLSALVRRFHAAADGVPVVLVPLPTHRYLTEDNEPHFQRRFTELAEPAAGLHVIDVTSGMRRAPREHRVDFNYRLDGHYTTTGHLAVAAALAEQLRQLTLVPAAQRPVAAPPDPAGVPRRDLTLHVGWRLDDGYAELRAGEAGRRAGEAGRRAGEAGEDGSVIAEHRESAIIGHACRPGVLPLSAVHACLEQGHVKGPELRAVVLHSPCAVSDLLRLDREDPDRFALISGWIRWHGAAEVDLRRFLCCERAFEHATERENGMHAGLTRSFPSGPPPEADDELRWLRERIERLPRVSDATAIHRRLLRLARRWELATRAVREAVLPTTAPLRRGRMAHRLARATDTAAGRS